MGQITMENEMFEPTGKCETLESLKRFLDEQLDERHESRISQHIAECERCREVISSVVAGAAEWDDLKRNLSDLRSIADADCDSACHPRSAYSDEQVLSFLAPTDDPEKLGRLGQYEVCGVIGAGSMGIVLKALDPSLGRYVAIKMLAPTLASSGLARKRFEREGRAIAAVRSAHVVQIHGVGEFTGTPYIVMQYLPAGSLQKRLDCQGTLTTREVCRIGMQIAAGLVAAHQQGIIHRDIKPANVMMQDGLDCAIVSDFGLARVIDEATMTQTGSISGTPQFMSPEQAKGEPLDEKTDLFSLGSVLYAACVGRPPFRGETLMGVVNRVCFNEPRKIRELNPDIDPWLAAFIARLMAKDPSKRFTSARVVSELLEKELAYLQNPTNLAEPNRDWMPLKRRNWGDSWRRRSVVSFLSVLAFVLLFSFIPKAVSPIALFSSSHQTSKTNTTIKNAIEPTQSELQFFEAKSAYDLAHETHLMERQLRGAMTQSIERHGKALNLGYNKANSSFNLARAYALEGNIDESIQWLENAISAGFHDKVSLTTSADLTSARSDVRYSPLVLRCTELEEDFQRADQLYFRDKDYSAAEKLYRELLQTCPNSDLCITMLAGALLHQGKLEEAQVWNERVRNSVQYASFGNYNLGCIAALNGNSELAFAFLNHAIDCGFTDIRHLQQDTQLASLSGEHQFELLISRMESILLNRKESNLGESRTNFRGFVQQEPDPSGSIDPEVVKLNLESEEIDAYFANPLNAPRIEGQIVGYSRLVSDINIKYTLQTSTKLHETRIAEIDRMGRFSIALEFALPFQTISLSIGDRYYCEIVAHRGMSILVDPSKFEKGKQPHVSEGVKFTGQDAEIVRYVNRFNAQNTKQLRALNYDLAIAQLEAGKSFEKQLELIEKHYSKRRQLIHEYVMDHPSEYSWIVEENVETEYCNDIVMLGIKSGLKYDAPFFSRCLAHQPKILSSASENFYHHLNVLVGSLDKHELWSEVLQSVMADAKLRNKMDQTEAIERFLLSSERRRDEKPFDQEIFDRGIKEFVRPNGKAIGKLDANWRVKRIQKLPPRKAALTLLLATELYNQENNIDAALTSLPDCWCKTILEERRQAEDQRTQKLKQSIQRSQEIGADKLGEKVFSKEGIHLFRSNQETAEQFVEEMIRAFPGKAIIVDYWSLSCGACLNDMEQSKAKKAEIGKLPVEIVYVCMDSKYESWVEKVVGSGIKGNHVFLNDELGTKVAKHFNFSSYPYFLFIDLDRKVDSSLIQFISTVDIEVLKEKLNQPRKK